MKWAWLVAAGCLVACGDSKTSKGSNDDGSQGGICAPTCPKACQADSDCDTSRGDMCCGFGDEGKACVPAKQCPRFCGSDKDCDTSSGEGCVRTTLLSTRTICADPQSAVRPCLDDSSCDTARGEKCCTNYEEPICLPAGSCPNSCTASTECDTRNEEVCCSTFSAVDPTLAASGLCVRPSVVACPKTCTASADCDTVNGQICCDGVCAYTCRKACNTSNDCRNEICCTAKVASSPWYGGTAAPGIITRPSSSETCTLVASCAKYGDVMMCCRNSSTSCTITVGGQKLSCSGSDCTELVKNIASSCY